jgi:3',5'-cyclic AMP phosphodiesterase CpdA
LTRIAHISDVHFGRISGKDVVRALVADLVEADPDAVVVSGDLTQRAYSWQYKAAREFLDELPDPVLVVPGNHDVWPMWWPLRRIRTPVGRFERVITDDLTPRIKLPRAWIVGLNSAHGRTVKGGRVNWRHTQALRESLRGAPEVRVLVIHHPLVRVPYASKADVCRGGELLLKAAGSCGVQVILSGHLHVVQNIRSEEGPLLVHAGTATSSRGRGPDRTANSYNIVSLDRESIKVERRDYDGTAFHAVSREIFAGAAPVWGGPGPV